MGRIRWREEMSVDRGLIDADHRHLIDIINRFSSHMAHGRPDVAGAVDILHALKFYTETHFAREERLQRLVRYPECLVQRADHRRLLSTLDGIMAKAAALDEATAPAVMQELGALLRRWLLVHIIQLDLRMKPYAERMRRHALGLPDLNTIESNPPAPASPVPEAEPVTPDADVCAPAA